MLRRASSRACCKLEEPQMKPRTLSVVAVLAVVVVAGLMINRMPDIASKVEPSPPARAGSLPVRPVLAVCSRGTVADAALSSKRPLSGARPPLVASAELRQFRERKDYAGL